MKLFKKMREERREKKERREKIEYCRSRIQHFIRSYNEARMNRDYEKMEVCATNIVNNELYIHDLEEA